VKLLNVLETKTSLKEDLIKDLQKSIHEKEEHEHECHCHDDADEEHEHKCHCHDDEDEEHEHECHCHHHHHDHDADEVFTSWGIETPKAVSKIALDKFLHTLATNTDLGIIVRAKGILKANDANTWYYFDYVMGDYEIRTGNADYTGRICVIGSKLNSEKVEKLFFEKE
jgi:G3E family GTPase